MQDDLTAELKQSKLGWSWSELYPYQPQLEKNKFVAKKALNELMANG